MGGIHTMPCIPINNGIVCYDNEYEMKTDKGTVIRFTYNAWTGPYFFNKDGESRKRIGRTVWKAFDRWMKEYREEYNSNRFVGDCI